MPGPPGKAEVEIKSKTEIELKWKPPLDDGGSLVTGYNIEKYDISSGKWMTLNNEQVCIQVDVF